MSEELMNKTKDGINLTEQNRIIAERLNLTNERNRLIYERNKLKSELEHACELFSSMAFNHISEINLASCFYYNTGSGYSENEKDNCIISTKDTSISIILPENLISVRFDPLNGYSCIIRNLVILSNENNNISIEPLNGILNKKREYIFFNTNPQFEIKGVTSWLKLKYDILLFKVESNNIIKKNNENIFISKWTRHLSAIPNFVSECNIPRVNLVTDSIEKHSLLGGVATALIIATLYANTLKIPLRIITRTTSINPLDYKKIIKINNIKEPEDISFYSDYDRDIEGKKNFKLEISKKDIFIATSWWSAMAIDKTTITERFFYVLQEVETFFYPHSDEYYFCSQVMKKSNINYIVNSKYLFDYFKENEPNIIKNGICFDPAFSENLYKNTKNSKNTKNKLFFYSRPNNPRNLFDYGVYLINLSIERGIINTNEWDIYFIGQDTPKVIFNNGYVAINKGIMDWEEYASFLNEVDLAICLMYTPHPSYPPYDVACSGGVVVSNKCLNKNQIYECNNILLGDLEEDSFLKTIESGIELAKNTEQRKINYKQSTIKRSWIDTLEDTIKFMVERSESVFS